MAKVTYGPPASTPTDRPSIMRHDVLGPGMMIGMSQRAAEYALGAVNTGGRYR